MLSNNIEFRCNENYYQTCKPAQENVVLFISHVGKSSSIEAVSTGTPVLAVPLFVDQFTIAANLKELGVGIVLDIFTLTEASLLSSIREILQNTRWVIFI